MLKYQTLPLEREYPPEWGAWKPGNNRKFPAYDDRKRKDEESDKDDV